MFEAGRFDKSVPVGWDMLVDSCIGGKLVWGDTLGHARVCWFWSRRIEWRWPSMAMEGKGRKEVIELSAQGSKSQKMQERRN